MFNKQQIKTRINRLTILADYLRDNVKKEKFSLDSWVKTYGVMATEDAAIAAAVKHDCGTTACAFGYAACIPKFRKAGLKYEYDYDGMAIVIFKNTYGLYAAEDFFNITNDESYYLFDPYNYSEGRKGKSYVVRRIHALVRKSEKQLAKLQKEIS